MDDCRCQLTAPQQSPVCVGGGILATRAKTLSIKTQGNWDRPQRFHGVRLDTWMVGREVGEVGSTQHQEFRDSDLFIFSHRCPKWAKK